MIQIFERLLLIIISLLDIRLPQVIVTRRRMKALDMNMRQLQDTFSAPKFIQSHSGTNYHLMSWKHPVNIVVSL